MKVTGSKILVRQLKDVPKEVRANAKKTIKTYTEKAARLARRLVPVDTGELKGWIHTKYDEDGMAGSVEAAPPTKEAQRKALAVEFGRTKGNRGTTAAQPYIRGAQAVIAPQFRKAMKSAVRRGLKAATDG